MLKLDRGKLDNELYPWPSVQLEWSRTGHGTFRYRSITLLWLFWYVDLVKER